MELPPPQKKIWRSILKFEVQKMKVIHIVISLTLPLPDGLGFHDLRTLSVLGIAIIWEWIDQRKSNNNKEKRIN